MSEEKKRYSNFLFVRDIWHFLKIYKKEFFFLSFLLVLSSLLGLIPAIILSKIIDLFANSDIRINQFYIYLFLLLAIMISDTLIRHTAKYYFSLYTNKIQKYAKVESFEKVMQGDLVWHDKENTGNKLQKIMEGDNSIGRFMDFYINKGIQIIVDITGIILIFAFFNIKYALLAILFIISYLTFELILNKKISKKSLEVNITKEKATGKAFEFSSNISTVKSLGMELLSNKQIALQEEKVLQAKKDKRKASSQKWVTVQIIAVIFYSIFIYLVGKDIISGILSIGSIVIYITYIRNLQNVLNIISSESMNFIDIKYGLFRMMEIYRSIPNSDDKDAVELKDWKKIKIKDVSFKYKNENILDKINLEIKKGQKIGIVGISGSGKSTLFKLLLKLYSPQHGEILFDDTPISKIKRESLIKRISIVLQETELFNLSLKDNITISSQSVDYNKYEKALLLSQLSPIISKLKNKDMSLVGEKGVRLSGGERQRLGIARAIYKGSDIIILDEATSNLDYETERKILDSFYKELKDKTLIISAHRLLTLKSVDKIFYIQNGKVIEEGSYEELVNKKGKFYSLLKNRSSN